MRMLRVLFVGFTLLSGFSAALAVEPDEMLQDPVLEARARAISATLRCLVCQNQSIDDSNAPLARDLRLLVRERLKAGDTNEEVIDFIVARYGEFVLLRPRFEPHTYLLWGAPVALLLLGLVLALRLFVGKGRSVADSAPRQLSDSEKARLKALLEEKS